MIIDISIIEPNGGDRAVLTPLTITLSPRVHKLCRI
jgi:hypothetical protein